MPLDLDMLQGASSVDPQFVAVLEHCHFGRTSLARETLERTLFGTDSLPRRTIEALVGSAERKSISKRSLVWQVGIDVWEHDWIKDLFSNDVDVECFDGLLMHNAQRMIVVANRLNEKHYEYFKELYFKGSRVWLIHISDENYKDDVSCYKYCVHIFRNYYSPLYAEIDNLTYLPLGYKSGFCDSSLCRTQETNYNWSFAGDYNKSNRKDMILAMSDIPGGYKHLTSGFFSSNNLSTPEYKSLLQRTVFAPCPRGNSNYDTFRLYEALEAGCIPIIEEDTNFKYFSLALGNHPIPVINRWSEAPSLISTFLRNGQIDCIRNNCSNWWAAYKKDLKSRISNTLSRH